MYIWSDMYLKWCIFEVVYIWSGVYLKYCIFQVLHISSDVYSKWYACQVVCIWSDMYMKWYIFQIMHIYIHYHNNDPNEKSYIIIICNNRVVKKATCKNIHIGTNNVQNITNRYEWYLQSYMQKPQTDIIQKMPQAYIYGK